MTPKRKRLVPKTVGELSPNDPGLRIKPKHPAEGLAGQADRQGKFRLPLRPIALTAAIAAACYLALVLWGDWSKLVDAVKRVPTWAWPLFLTFATIGYAARWIRWVIFLKYLGTQLPVRIGLMIYGSGFALGMTPAKIGEGVKAVFMRPYSVPYAVSIGSFVAERAVDIVALSILAIAAAWHFEQYRAWAAATAIVVLGGFLLLRSPALTTVIRRLPKLPAPAHLISLHESICTVLTWPRIPLALSLSLLAWSLEGAIFYLLLSLMGSDVPFVVIIGVFALGLLAGAASFLPGGLGSTEVVVLALLALLKVDASTAIVAVLLGRMSTLWFGVLLGTVFLLKLTGQRTKELESASFDERSRNMN